jgi:hypothetical protein
MLWNSTENRAKKDENFKQKSVPIQYLERKERKRKIIYFLNNSERHMRKYELGLQLSPCTK